MLRSLMAGLVLGVSASQGAVSWRFAFNDDTGRQVDLGALNPAGPFPERLSWSQGGTRVGVTIERADDQLRFTMNASAAAAEPRGYLSLVGQGEAAALFSYARDESQEICYRQSPHNPATNPTRMAKQDLPMIGFREPGETLIAVSDSPVFSDNYTTQWFRPAEKTAVLSSGDNGSLAGSAGTRVKLGAYYHDLAVKGGHTFRGIIFSSRAQGMVEIRRDVLTAIARRWGAAHDRFGITAFATNYMLLRRNETGQSPAWVVPGIAYCNKQYSRDAFWQSMALPNEWAAQCYQNEQVAQSPGAERPLFLLIWAWRTKQEGGAIDRTALQATLDYIESHAREGRFYSSERPDRKDFQSWFDTVAFEPDDVLTYNQGLLAVALAAAEKLGLHPRTAPALASQRYREMFNAAGGYFPVSAQKNLVAVDALVGDALAQVMLGHTLLPDELVARHFKKVVGVAKTPYGYKVVCQPDGAYARQEDYNAKDFPIKPTVAGNYQYGGSWFLYDMLFLTSAYLHRVPGAREELLWRAPLDFRLSGTYCEYINTATGEPTKLNQGWNAGIYGIWMRLIQAGLADDAIFRAIDQLDPAAH